MWFDDEGEHDGLPDPGFEERRVLFECRVDRTATTGTP